MNKLLENNSWPAIKINLFKSMTIGAQYLVNKFT